MTQTAGTLGTVIGTKLNRPMTDIRTLTITGMAAGLTVLFGAPLGSALFALEILHRRGLQYYEALLPAIVGSLCGLGVYTAIGDLGIKPIWEFPPVPTLHARDLTGDADAAELQSIDARCVADGCCLQTVDAAASEGEAADL